VTLYLDTSSLVKLYVTEADSEVVRRLVGDANVVATSVVAYPETRAALARLRREGVLTASPTRSFRIVGGGAGLKVSWQITGIRHDAWADAHRIPLEEDKSPAERGRYLNPELHGAPAEAGLQSTNRPGHNGGKE